MSYRDMDLSLGGLRNQGLHDVGLQDSMSISEDDDVLFEIDISDPRKGWSKSEQQLTKVDISRVSSSLSIDEAHEAIENLPGNPPELRPFTEDIVVRHPSTKGELRIPKEMLPKVPSSVTKDQMTEILQEKINRGHDIVKNLMKDHEPLPDVTSMGDVTDVMWYLHTMAENKAGAHWKEGAISIDDPNGKLHKYLDQCEHAYQRLSTHVSGFQSGEDGRARGIDCYGDKHPDGLLPYGMQTLLYHKMGQEGTEKTPGMPNNMLLLKMEKYGAYDAKQQLPGQGPTRVENQHDRGAWWGHVGTTIKSIARRVLGMNTPEGSRKERMSSGMQKAYDKLANWSLFRNNLPKEVRTILQQNNPGNTASGVRVMKQNVDEAIAWLKQNGGTQEQLAKLEQFSEKYLNNPHWDHMDKRVGNEVILTREDLENPSQLVHAQGAKALQHTKSDVDKRDLLFDSKTHLLNSLNAPEGTGTYDDLQPTGSGEGVCKQFKKDMMDRAGKLSIGGKEIAWDPDEQPRGTSRLNALKEFFTDEDGILDEDGLLMASKLMNQIAVSTLIDTLQVGENAPWPGTVVVVDPKDQRLSFDLSRDTEGRVHVQIKLEQDSNMLMSLQGETDMSPGATFSQQLGVMLAPGTREGVQITDINYMAVSKE